jgi:hypothetical protein
LKLVFIMIISAISHKLPEYDINYFKLLSLISYKIGCFDYFVNKI